MGRKERFVTNYCKTKGREMNARRPLAGSSSSYGYVSNTCSINLRIKACFAHKQYFLQGHGIGSQCSSISISASSVQYKIPSSLLFPGGSRIPLGEAAREDVSKPGKAETAGVRVY